MSLTAFSQADTTKVSPCTIKLSCEIAKQIAVDLERGDSVKAELISTQTILKLTEEKVAVKDSIINEHIQKEHIYKEMLAAYEEKCKTYEEVLDMLEKANRKQKRLTKVFRTATGIIGATAVAILLVK